MIAGIKVGLPDWQEKLTKSKAEFCEIWFRLDWQEKYIPLFKYLNKRKIGFGLHFWAAVDNKYFPDFLYLKKGIAEKSYKLVLETIDICSKYGGLYVNFHPESYRLMLLDLDKNSLSVLDETEAIDREESFKQLVHYLQKINSFARLKNVAALIETVPKYSAKDYRSNLSRFKPQKCEGMEIEKFERLAKMGYSICFDIGHTMGQIISDNRQEIFSYVYRSAQKLLPAIRLVHVTTNVPPFNGTDSHNGILAEDFKQGAMPEKEQIIKILKLFKGRKVWFIPEPSAGKMIENYFELKRVIDNLEISMVAS